VGKDNETKGFNDQSLNAQQGSTPTPPTSTLIICKTVINQASGATFQPSDFMFTFSNPANPCTFEGNNDRCTAVTVALGTFTFAEFVPQFVTGFAVLFSSGCDFVDFTSNPNGVLVNGTIAPGETRTCTVTNTITMVIRG